MPETEVVNEKRTTLRTLGALYDGRATTFRVWAPDHPRVDLVLDGEVRPLAAAPDGYWEARVEDVRPGTRYQYRLGGAGEQTFPDPASRFQPEGVHGPSQVIDPSAFTWTDAAWRAPDFSSLVIYELHVGTFTPAGTFRAAIDRLPALAELGVTAVEIMPVADFPGDRNWGYDGVAIFAPARCYGTPDDLRALIDAAHRHRLAVFLDVVYNHFGPDGAYANAFSKDYFTDAHSSPWGRGVNLDGPRGGEVRRFFIENAIHWVHEYHVDGLRLDATHALIDESPRHFLAELTATVRAHTPRPVYFVAEDHRNLAQLLLPVDAGGYGLDGVWADDFHHQARVHTAHDSEGYYGDFSGSARDLARTIEQGWFYTGQRSKHMGEQRGTDPAPVRPQQFVICIQNHDQIGNRADGARLNHQIDLAAYRALSALLLLTPQTPLLFMGQEWAASAPFLFFTDHNEELGQKVTEGRREEFKSFEAFANPEQRARIPDPQAADTFERSRLEWAEAGRAPHVGVRRLYQRLLALRQSIAGLQGRTRDTYAARALDEHTVALAYPGESLLLVARLGGGAGTIALRASGAPHVVLTTEDPDIANDLAPIEVLHEEAISIGFARPGAVLLRGVRLAD